MSKPNYPHHQIHPPVGKERENNTLVILRLAGLSPSSEWKKETWMTDEFFPFNISFWVVKVMPSKPFQLKYLFLFPIVSFWYCLKEARSDESSDWFLSSKAKEEDEWSLFTYVIW